MVVSSELSNTTTTESNGRKLKLEKKPTEESQNFKRAEKLVCAQRGFAGASSSIATKFTIFIKKSYLLKYLLIPRYASKYYMPKEKAMFNIHHPDGKRSWDVTYSSVFGMFKHLNGFFFFFQIGVINEIIALDT